MKEEEKMKVLNLLMWLQVSIYASDECEPIKWFYNHRTKQSLKSTVDIILKEHGKTINALWNTDGIQMPLVTQVMDKFTKSIAELEYYKLPDINLLIDLYNEGKLEALITFNKKLENDDKLPNGGRE